MPIDRSQQCFESTTSQTDALLDGIVEGSKVSIEYLKPESKGRALWCKSVVVHVASCTLIDNRRTNRDTYSCGLPILGINSTQHRR
jgi:hypothetical protein